MSTAQTTPASATKARAPRGSKKADAKPARKPRADKAAAVKPKAPRAVKPAADGVITKSTDALRRAAAHYVHDKEHKTAGGHASVNNGDKVANMLLGKSLEEVYKIASEHLGDTQKDLKEKYGHLNVGMIRMNLGNRLRAVLMPKK